MASAKLWLDKRQSKNNGEFPLKIRITHERKSRGISLKVSALESQWDGNELNSNFKGYKQTNKTLRRKLSLAENFIEANTELIAQTSINELKAMIEKEINQPSHQQESLINEFQNRLGWGEKQIMVFGHIDENNKSLRKAQRFKTAEIGEALLKNLKKSLRGKDVPLVNVDYQFIKDFEIWWRSKEKGNSWNSLSVYLRHFRTVINEARKKGILPKENRPFEFYKIRHEKTKNRSITREEIERMCSILIHPKTRLWKSQQYFNFQFRMAGMNFIDIAFLTKSNIEGDRIIYSRSKTKGAFDMLMSPEAKRILNYFLSQMEKDQKYIFPIIPKYVQGNTEKEYERYVDYRLRYNRDLKELAKQAKVEANVTSYVARHTWADEARKKNVPIQMISQLMGHSDVKVTQTYLSKFNNSELDAINQSIVG